MQEVGDQHIANMQEAQGEVVNKMLPVVCGCDSCKTGQRWHWDHYLYCGSVS